MKHSAKGWIIALAVLMVGGVAGGATYLTLANKPNSEQTNPSEPDKTYSITFKSQKTYPYGDLSYKPTTINNLWIKDKVMEKKDSIFTINGTLPQGYDWDNNLIIKITNQDDKKGRVGFSATLKNANSKNTSINQSLVFENFKADAVTPTPTPTPTPQKEYNVSFKTSSSFALGDSSIYSNDISVNETWVKQEIIKNKAQIFNITDRNNVLNDAFFTSNLSVTTLASQPISRSITFLCTLSNPTNTNHGNIQKNITFTNFKDPQPVVVSEANRINGTTISLKNTSVNEDYLNTLNTSNILAQTNLTLNVSAFDYVVQGFNINRGSHNITFNIKVILKEVPAATSTTNNISLSYTIASTPTPPPGPTPPVTDPLQTEVDRVNALTLSLKQATYTTTEATAITNANVLSNINGFNQTSGFTYTVEPADFVNNVPSGAQINDQTKNISFAITISSGSKSLKSKTFTLDYHIAKTQLEGIKIENDMGAVLELKDANLTAEQANNITADNIISKVSGLNTTDFNYVVSGFAHDDSNHIYSFNIKIENKVEPKNPYTVEDIQVEYTPTTSTAELTAEKTRIEAISPLQLKNSTMTSAELASINQDNLIGKLANLEPKAMFNYTVTDFSNDSANSQLKFKIVIESSGNQETTRELSVAYTINDAVESAVTRIVNHLNSFDLQFDDTKMQQGTFLKLNDKESDTNNFVLNFLNFDYKKIEKENPSIRFSAQDFSINVIDYTCTLKIGVRNTATSEEKATNVKTLTYTIPSKFLGELDQQETISEVSVANSQKGKLEKITVEQTSEGLYSDRFATINSDVKQKIKELVYQVRFIFYQSFSDNATSIDYGITNQTSTSATVQLKAKIKTSVTLDQLILINQKKSQTKTYNQGDIVTITLSATGLNDNWNSMGGGVVLPGLSSSWSFAPGDAAQILAGSNPKLFAASMGNMTLSVNADSSDFVARGFCFMRPYKKP